MAIFIPTYKRHIQLTRCLLSIAQSDCDWNDVNVYVSNNLKGDQGAKSIVDGMKLKIPTISYSENEQNIGIDGNMQRAFLLDEEYCLMMGDDDELHPKAYSSIIQFLNQENIVSFFVTDALKVDRLNKKCYRYYGWNENRIQTDLRMAFEKNHNRMTYGMVICNLEHARQTDLTKSNRFMGTYHYYSGALWDIALNNGAVMQVGRVVTIKNEDCEKSYEKYKEDVLVRAIPEWYSKIGGILREVAMEARKTYIIDLYRSAGDKRKLIVKNLYPETITSDIIERYMYLEHAK